jgi:hypothetical protein
MGINLWCLETQESNRCCKLWLNGGDASRRNTESDMINALFCRGLSDEWMTCLLRSTPAADCSEDWVSYWQYWPHSRACSIIAMCTRYLVPYMYAVVWWPRRPGHPSHLA